MLAPEDLERLKEIADTLLAEGHDDDAQFLKGLAEESEEASSEDEDEGNEGGLDDPKKGIIITLLKKKKSEREGS